MQTSIFVDVKLKIMKKYSLITLIGSLLAIFLFSCHQKQQETALNPVAEKLFNGVKSALNNTEKNTIADSLAFILTSNDKESPFAFANDSASWEFPFSAIVSPLDLNNDGVEELFVSYGNTYTSGNAGGEVALFAKNGAGNYVSVLSYSGVLPFALPTSNKGYPDLALGMPGFTFPVYQWNGSKYEQNREISDDELKKLKTTETEKLSEQYQEKR